MSLFEIDPDIRKARTIGSEFYTDSKWFELSKERIFARTWQLLGRADEIHNLKPATILPEFLDEPVLLVKGAETVSCISNVCTHRGKILVEESCDADLIRCSYHGRRFALDGKMISMPEFEDVEDFPSETDDLAKVPFAERGGFLFASVNPCEQFDAFVGAIAAHLDGVDPGALRLTEAKSYEINAHWALYCENYLEGFHIPFVHHALNSVVDYGSYTTEMFRYSSLQTGYGNNGVVAGRYLFIFPNTMFNFYPWGISVNVVRPISPDETIVEYTTFVSDESMMDHGAGRDLHGVEMEDEAVVESVQRGIRSRFYSRGRYSPTREQGTHHFHRLIAEFMG